MRHGTAILSVVVCCAIVAGLSGTAEAAKKKSKKKLSSGKGRIGLGASLNVEGLTNASPALGFGHLHVPVLLSPQFRLEPTFGFANSSTTNKTGTGDMEMTTDNSLTLLRLGTGVFYNIPYTRSTALYVGPRLGILLNTTSTTVDIGGNDSTTDTSRLDFYAGLAFGGEYFFTKSFSLGGEAQFMFISTGNTTTTVDGDEPENPPEMTGTTLTTSALIFVRWYFAGK